MRNLDFNKIGLQEMNTQEMLSIEGGGWLSRTFDKLVDALQDAYDWLKGKGVKVGTDADDFAS